MNSEAAYWLALLNAGELKLSTIKPVAQQWYLMEGKPIAELFNLSVAEVSLHFNVAENVAEKILKTVDTYQRQLKIIEQWKQQGVEVLPLSHPNYPTRLLYTLPPRQQPLVLWAKGNLKLLAEPTVTVLGNPDPVAETVESIQNLVSVLVEEEIGMVSGYGKGLDRLAFETMLATPNGFGVAILPLGLATFVRLTQKLNAPVAAGKTVLLSPFAPDTAYQESFSAARNLLVDSLAMVLLVPQIDQTALPRAKAGLERGMPVLVGKTDTPENRELIAAGAFLMTDPAEVVELVQQAVIDNAMQSQIAQKPAVEEAPPPPPKSSHNLLNDTDDYALGKEVAEPLSPDRTMTILSAGGTVPNSLRARLMALEKEHAESEAESGSEAE